MQLVRFTISIVALTLVGCATHSVQKPPATADKRASKSPDEDKRKKPLVAPPPAYGNRVVATEIVSRDAG